MSGRVANERLKRISVPHIPAHGVCEKTPPAGSANCQLQVFKCPSARGFADGAVLRQESLAKHSGLWQPLVRWLRACELQDAGRGDACSGKYRRPGPALDNRRATGPGALEGGRENLNVRSRSFVVLHIIHDRLRAITQSPRNAIKFEPQGVMHSNLQLHVCLSL